MEIYLIRHTTPAIATGICYGQADIEVAESFKEEAAHIQEQLPNEIICYSSPLKRCSQLAKHIYPNAAIVYADELKEMYFGEWELQSWDHIPNEPLNVWMKDFVNVRVPGGENYLDLYSRTISFYNQVIIKNQPAAIFTHSGNIRSILSYTNKVPLEESFSKFKIGYGEVVKLPLR
ncbi:MAG: alpha-ribazole phosphatase family protein [Bacteroidetes bacterium]|nr:alpha-ribazole phosphatase family protein [Bacteroidota bacterium]